MQGGDACRNLEKILIKIKVVFSLLLKGGHIFKNCTSKIQSYKCSKRHHIALCAFEQNKNDKVHSQINNDCNETSCNFISLANIVLLQIAFATKENDSFQYRAKILFDNGSQSSYITYIIEIH